GNGSPGNYTYSGSDNADSVAWYNLTVQAEMTGSQATQPVGSKQPNTLGLFDMSGNVSEWVWDCFASYKDSYYSTASALTNPRGPASGTERIRRGGAWSNAVGNVRSVVRNSQSPGEATWVNGFRVVRGPGVIW
ncbi:MAG: SUMF1/EgtB/PvdO family nonheme iron enzyme, partial [Treponema sp.]|nr:SUMF1/EgtB/PvdO family nonheme iron enzyme [Treponema sp.]